MAHFKISLGIILDFFIYGVGGIHAVTLFENFEEFLKLNYFLIRFTSSSIVTIGTIILIVVRIIVSLKKLNEPHNGDETKVKKTFWNLFE